MRVITLDSSVPGRVEGRIGGEQLAWLRAELENGTEAGTVLVFHHPPIGLNGYPFLDQIGLQDRAELGSIVADTDVVAMLCGHYHLALGGELSGVPVWVTPGVVTRIDVTGGPSRFRGVTGAGASVIDLFAGALTVHVLPARDPSAGRIVYDVAADTLKGES